MNPQAVPSRARTTPNRRPPPPPSRARAAPGTPHAPARPSPAASAAEGNATPSPQPPTRLGTAQRLKLTANLSRQLQVLVATGTPLSQALHAVERTTRQPAWRAVIASLRHDVDEGTPLSVSMRASGTFDDVAISLVAAGETSGNMGAMLARLAELSRRQLKLRTAITSALIYPALLTLLGIVVLLTMLVFVIPRFETLFASLDTPLPATTRAVLNVSELLRNHWLAWLLGLSGVLGAAVWLWRNPNTRARLDTWVLALPTVGELARSLASARVSRMLGTLLESKVPLLDSLALTRQGCASTEYARLLSRAEDAVARGEPLSSVFDQSDLLVPCVQEAIRNGEQSGQMGLPLCQLADFLDEENDVIVKTLTGLLEPSILIGLGLLVGFIAVSIFLPMFDLVTAAQGGGGMR